MSDYIMRTSQSERTVAAAGRRDTMTGDENSMMYRGRLIFADVQLVVIMRRAAPRRGHVPS